jgi:hypothetical protein
MHNLLHLYRTPGLDEFEKQKIINCAQRILGPVELETEICYNVDAPNLNNEDMAKLKWLLGETFEPKNLSFNSFLEKVCLII